MDQLSKLRLMHFSSAQRKLRGGVISKLVRLRVDLNNEPPNN